MATSTIATERETMQVRLRLEEVAPRVISEPAQHASRRAAVALGRRVHRRAQAEELNRMPFQRGRT